MFSATPNPSSLPNVSPPEAQVATPPVIPEHRTHLQHIWFVIENYFRYIVSKLLVIVLTAHSFYALWESVLFAIVEYPELQHLLETAQMTQAQLNFVLADAIITLASSIIGAILAIRLNAVREHFMHTLDLIITILLIIFQSSIRTYLLSLDFVSRFLTLF